MALYRRMRPTEFEEVMGQQNACQVLTTKIANRTLPHVVLLSGPSGVGKTTLARIAAKELGCTEGNLIEMNCAQFRGIDTVHEISNAMTLSPMGGKCRVWILDEIIQTTKLTQQAFLKVLEDTSPKAYFFLCASETTGLLPTFMSRCFRLELQPLSTRSLIKIIDKACDSEKRVIHAELTSVIAGKAQGSARKALQILEAALVYDKHDQQMECVKTGETAEDDEGQFLAKAVFDGKPYTVLALIVDKLKDNELEGVRRATLAYAAKVMLGGNKMTKAASVVKEFKDSFQWSGKAGMMLAIYNLCFAKS